MTGSVAASAKDDYSRRNLTFVVEQMQMTATLFHETLGRRQQRISKSLRHVDISEVRRLPELDLCGCYMDPQIRSELIFDTFDQQTANVIHVHMGKHTSVTEPRSIPAEARRFVS